MSRVYRIRNWAKFQHYRDRNPPWIKLHVEILASEDWVTLDDASKLLAVVCMVIAAKQDGNVPDNPAYIKRVAYLKKLPDLQPLVQCGFLEPVLADASTVLANASASLQTVPFVRPEKETSSSKKSNKSEKETESISAVPASKPIPKPKSVLNGHEKDFNEFWAAYPKRVDKRDAMKAYAKALIRADASVILEGARGYARSRKDEDAQFTKGPAHWLNADCWLDESPISEGNAPDPELLRVQEIEAAFRKEKGYE